MKDLLKKCVEFEKELDKHTRKGNDLFKNRLASVGIELTTLIHHMKYVEKIKED